LDTLILRKLKSYCYDLIHPIDNLLGAYFQWWSQGHKPRGQGLDSQGQDQDQGLQNCPRGRGLVLEDSNTTYF